MDEAFSVRITNFKTKQQAREFLRWYEGGGEQAFSDHLADNGLTSHDGCNVDISYRGNTNMFYDFVDNEYTIRLES